ncbi:putative dTDP-4-rhamnose reductase-related protein [Pseudomonas aeruginosa PA38182]|nr:putative dTDP-4-rhamnose reductase-related protein [Pseudomonas aeruginosa PA38182]
MRRVRLHENNGGAVRGTCRDKQHPMPAPFMSPARRRMSLPWGVRRVAIHYQISSAPYTMRMRLMLLGGGNALGQALIRLGAEEDIGFLAPRPPEQGWDAASLTTLLDETRPDAVINLAFYHDWFQAEQVEAERWAPRSAPSSASRSSASTTRSCWSSRPATGSSTAPAPPPTARRTRPFRWACVARRSGAWSRACARPARDMC